MTKSGQTALLKNAQERLDNLTHREYEQTRLNLGIRQSKDELVNSIRKEIDRNPRASSSNRSR